MSGCKKSQGIPYLPVKNLYEKNSQKVSIEALEEN